MQIKKLGLLLHNFSLITPGQKIWRTLNLAHPRASPTVQELLVDIERLDPDFHGGTPGPLMLHLSTPVFEPPEVHGTTLIAFVNTGKIIFSCLGLSWADFAFIILLLFSIKLGWNDSALIWIQKLHALTALSKI